MKRLDANDVKELNLLKHYRIIRKWACRNNDLNDADLELLIYLDCMDMFTKKDFEAGSYSYSCLLYTSPSPRDATLSRMPSSA